MLGAEMLRVDHPTRLAFGQVGVEHATDFRVEPVIRVGVGRGPLLGIHGNSSSCFLSAAMARAQSLSTAPAERSMRLAISSTGTCSKLRIINTSR